jgi:hypothetical protein
LSCLHNVLSVAGLFIFVLCTLCCRCLWKTQDEDKQSIDTHNTGYTRHRTPSVVSVSGLFIFILFLVYTMWSVALDCLSWYCVPYVVGVYGLFIFVLCLVYPVLWVSMDCLSSSCVLCTQCCGCLWVVYLHPFSCLINNP